MCYTALFKAIRKDGMRDSNVEFWISGKLLNNLKLDTVIVLTAHTRLGFQKVFEKINQAGLDERWNVHAE